MQQFEEGLRTGSDKDKANVRQSKASIPTACDIGTGYSYFDLMDRDEDGRPSNFNMNVLSLMRSRDCRACQPLHGARTRRSANRNATKLSSNLAAQRHDFMYTA